MTERGYSRQKAASSGGSGALIGIGAFALVCIAWTIVAVNFSAIPAEWQVLAGLIGALLTVGVLIGVLLFVICLIVISVIIIAVPPILIGWAVYEYIIKPNR